MGLEYMAAVPTSVASERIFSIGGLTVTKLRNKLTPLRTLFFNKTIFSYKIIFKYRLTMRLTVNNFWMTEISVNRKRLFSFISKKRLLSFLGKIPSFDSSHLAKILKIFFNDCIGRIKAFNIHK
ncbi:hypothetical protein BpHYR1_007133 [Brachionus plicatilis]|uniref:HAT C-terminal dimerisation domain-containing protein n=1 Tax=Brachionus plicatilis TaxID=10195 RepID=A0A3M7T766_BRAPC|nr:hypothetical protein BpHYR1_007133 [Brachionus plicatilis]